MSQTGCKRIHVVVHGRVQGVFFRDHTKSEADKRGLLGWVRNRPSGTVEVEVEGKEQMVESLLKWLSVGSPLALVTGVEYKEMPLLHDEERFVVRY